MAGLVIEPPPHPYPHPESLSYSRGMASELLLTSGDNEAYPSTPYTGTHPHPSSPHPSSRGSSAHGGQVTVIVDVSAREVYLQSHLMASLPSLHLPGGEILVDRIHDLLGDGAGGTFSYHNPHASPAHQHTGTTIFGHRNTPLYTFTSMQAAAVKSAQELFCTHIKAIITLAEEWRMKRRKSKRESNEETAHSPTAPTPTPLSTYGDDDEIEACWNSEGGYFDNDDDCNETDEGEDGESTFLVSTPGTTDTTPRTPQRRRSRASVTVASSPSAWTDPISPPPSASKQRQRLLLERLAASPARPLTPTAASTADECSDDILLLSTLGLVDSDHGGFFARMCATQLYEEYAGEPLKEGVGIGDTCSSDGDED